MTEKAQWVELNAEELPEDIQLQYLHYKELYKQAKQAREQFEKLMAIAAEVPAGKRMVFGYNFGKLSVAVVADDRETKPKAGKLSLAQFMQQQQASGRAI